MCASKWKDVRPTSKGGSDKWYDYYDGNTRRESYQHFRARQGFPVTNQTSSKHPTDCYCADCSGIDIGSNRNYTSNLATVQSKLTKYGAQPAKFSKKPKLAADNKKQTTLDFRYA